MSNESINISITIILGVINILTAVIFGVKALSYSKKQTQIALAALNPDRKVKVTKHIWKVYFEIVFNFLLLLFNSFAIISFVFALVPSSFETWWSRIILVFNAYGIPLSVRYLRSSLQKPRVTEEEA